MSGTLSDAVVALSCSSAHGISGLVVEYIVAIDVTRVRFPADALELMWDLAATEEDRAVQVRIEYPSQLD